MKILVIGATGYVGSHFARAFGQREHAVVGLARNADTAERLAATGIAAHESNIEDSEARKAQSPASMSSQWRR